MNSKPRYQRIIVQKNFWVGVVYLGMTGPFPKHVKNQPKKV